MRIPNDIYEEDQKYKQDRINELEQSMKDESSQGFYGSIKTATK